MLTPEQIEAHLERVLLQVQRPGRYVGGEYNSIHKAWDAVQIHAALVFPDIYDIGVSNIGLKILYDEINRRDDALAERAYAPWLDMETVIRQHDIPLFAIESKQPLACFDLIGFSLPYETLYTNALNILDLSGIPIHSAERGDSHPLIIAGGHACFNPEPMHAFIDAFVIGEGEEVIHDILDVLMLESWKVGRLSDEPLNHPTLEPLNREKILLALANIPGVYVPSFYEVTYQEDGTVASIIPNCAGVPPTVVKRIAAKLPPAPTNFIVPNIEIVHNRVTVEIMRGCTRGCRFCQAGMITRPVRERSVDEILETAERAVQSTGFEELTLQSLSSSDYTDIADLVNGISQRFRGRKLSISLPSLRIDTVSIDLMEKLKEHRTSGFTLAPEAATERMRRIINKPLVDDDLITVTREIYARGWTSIKLYFMIGHPSETLEDVQAIASLCKRVLAEGRKVIGWKAKLNVGMSTFVPKPQTPFQWVALDTVQQIKAKQGLLKDELRDKNIKLSWTPPNDTLLESLLTRGDRRLADVIHSAWRSGAKFDAWDEGFKWPVWIDALAQHGLDLFFYTHRPRRLDEIFPWEHISDAVRKKFIFEDFRRSLEGEIRMDCREQCYACGILPAFASARRENPGSYWKCPEVKSGVKIGRQ
jgi:radical SAM family uncharacterized protein